jgi:hypothetical protein
MAPDYIGQSLATDVVMLANGFGDFGISIALILFNKELQAFDKLSPIPPDKFIPDIINIKEKLVIEAFKSCFINTEDS